MVFNKRKVFGYFLFAIIFFAISALPANAYIDPGVGSMLFSLIICSVATLYFLFGLTILKIKRFIFSEKSLLNNFHPFVIFSEGNQYYSVFKPIIDEFESRKINLTYYTSSPDDIFLSEKYKYIKCEYIGRGYKAYAKLAFLKADVCLMTTPQLDVLQFKRSKYTKHYSHIFHSIGFSMDYKMFVLDYYDSILCDAEFQIPLIRQTEQKRNTKPKELIVVGSTYMDYNKSKIKKINHSAYTILVAPSWGQFGLLSKHGDILFDDLLKTNYKIIIRPHPQSLLSEKKLIDNLLAKYNGSQNIEWDFNSNNIEALSKADLLISDFSSIMFDYAFLFKKPFLYVKTDIDFKALDCCDLNELPPWRYKIMNVIGRELKLDNINNENMIKTIEELKNNTNIEEEITKACNYAWQKQGQASKNIADFLVETQKRVSKC